MESRPATLDALSDAQRRAGWSTSVGRSRIDGSRHVAEQLAVIEGEGHFCLPGRPLERALELRVDPARLPLRLILVQPLRARDLEAPRPRREVVDRREPRARLPRYAEPGADLPAQIADPRRGEGHELREAAEVPIVCRDLGRSGELGPGLCPEQRPRERPLAACHAHAGDGPVAPELRRRRRVVGGHHAHEPVRLEATVLQRRRDVRGHAAHDRELPAFELEQQLA